MITGNVLIGALISRGKKEDIDKKYNKTVNTVKSYLSKKHGVKYFSLSQSNTSFGQSWYLTGYRDIEDNYPIKIRISDHSVGTGRFVNDNSIFLNYDKPAIEIKKSIDRYFK